MAISMVEIRGHYEDAHRTLRTGSVTLTPSFPISNGTTLITTIPVTADLVNGNISITVAADDDTGTTPTGMVYQVTETLDVPNGPPQVTKYLITVSASNAATGIDLATAPRALVSQPQYAAYLTQITGDARYLQTAGGTLTGALTLPALRMTTSPANGSILTSDATGNASWQAPSTDWINVKTKGAKGDGVTDDTAAVQAAIDAGPPVYFPPGIYLVGTLEARLGMVLIGAMRSAYAYPVPAARSSTLKLKSGTNGNLLHAADGINNVQIHDLAFDGNKAGNSSGDIIHLDDASAQDTSWHLSDCYFDNAPHDGIYIGSGRQAVKTERVWVMRAANNGVTVNGSDTGLHATLIGLSGQDGVNVGVNAWVVHLNGCDIWSSTRNGINSTAGAFSLLLTNCGIDRHQQAGLAFGGGGTISVVGCSFHSNSASGNGTYPHISVTGGVMTLAGALFGTSSPSSLPSYCVGITGGTLLERGNYLYPASVVTGYVSDPTKVSNAFTGSLTVDVASQVNIGGSGSTASLAILRATSSDQILSGRITGNTVSRIAVQADGLHQWSNGSATADVGLNRTGPNLLGVTTADLAIATAGRGLRVAEGTNAKMGTLTLTGATPVVVPTTAVTATSRIYLTTNAPGGTPGHHWVSARTPGTSFSVTGTAGDTSTVAWMIVEPA